MSDYKLVPMSTVDELAQLIRKVDGNHKMGAGALAEKICERFRVDTPAVQGEPARHEWDEQDKCRRCGDRDWYAGPICTPKQPAEQQPDVTQLVGSTAAALDEIEALKAECEELRKDADRYRWLRDPCSGAERVVMYGRGDYGRGLMAYTMLDEAIDAAMEGDKP